MDIKLAQWKEDFDYICNLNRNEQGGMERLAFTDSDNQAHGYIENLAVALGMKTKLDGAGNLWITKQGSQPDLPPLLMGSHMDTVPNGGQYDGFLGVLTAFQVMRLIAENHIAHQRTMELIVFRCEESSRFNLSTVGSKLLTGILDRQELENNPDSNGISILDELAKLGCHLDGLEAERNHIGQAYGFLEVHIEQGPMLWTKKVDIGIVDWIAAPMRLKVAMQGRADHSGTCPMHLRHDALAGASEVILAVEHFGLREAQYRTVATVGKCTVFHQAMNIVPGDVELCIDIRGIDKASVQRVYDHVIQQAESACAKRDLKCKITQLSIEEPIAMDRGLMDHIEQGCKKSQLSYRYMPSGAGHDSMNIEKLVPTAMIFIPCVDGVSHNPREAVRDQDICNGIQLLYQVALDICQC